MVVVRRNSDATANRRSHGSLLAVLQCVNIGLCGSLISGAKHREDGRSTVDALHCSPSNFPGKAAPITGPIPTETTTVPEVWPPFRLSQ
jgi:hypothetical protein